MDPAPGRPGEHHVGPALGNDMERFPYRQIGGGLAHGDRVVRAAKLVVDGNVAGRHVGQILEEPQGRHLGHPLDRPAGELEPALLVQAREYSLGELLGYGQDVVGPEIDPRPLRIEPVRAQSRVVHRPLCHGHAHLALAAHDLQALTNGLFLVLGFWVLGQESEIVDLALELIGLGAEIHRQSGGGEPGQRAHAATALAQCVP